MSQKLFRLDDRVALITGAGKGIGAAIARHFAEAGGAGSVGMVWPRARGALREVGALGWYAVSGRL